MTLPLPNGAEVQVAPAQVPVLAAANASPTSLNVIPVVGPQGGRGASGAGTEIFGETPTGTQDGVNATFTTVHNFQTGTTGVYRNGLREQRGVGYTETAPNTIVFTTAPLGGDTITVDYLVQ